MFNSLYAPGSCVDQLNNCSLTGSNPICSAADNFCARNVESLYDTVTKRSEYDIRELDPTPFPPNFYVAYLNTPLVQSAIGAFVNFSASSAAVGNAFGSTGDDGREDGTIAALQELLQQGIYVSTYAGDADYNCNWLGGEAVAAEVMQERWGIAGYVNLTTVDGIVHGQVKQAGNFSFTRIYESGHEVFPSIHFLNDYSFVLESRGREVRTNFA